MQEKIMKKFCKTFLIIAFICMLLMPFSIELSCGVKESPRSPGLVSGSVYYSSDNLTKIYEGTNWSCINITTYCIGEYRNGTVDLAVDNGSIDQGEAHPDKLYDEFKFDPAYQWANENFGKEHIAVGENEINGSCYVFITNFFYNLTPMMHSFCKTTEWEPMPKPVAYKRSASWINISIPKFTNPQKELYDNLTTNADNTIGFAVYRNETNNSWTLDKDYLKLGEATYFEDSYYYFNDTNLCPRTTYYYAVAPIAKGGYITYCKSLGVEISTIPLIILNSPNGNEDWTGNTSHSINYTISGGSPGYVVEIYNSSDGGVSWSLIDYDNRTSADTYEYLWLVPTMDSVNCQIRINVLDNKLVKDFDTTDDMFEIDSTPPNVETTSPEDGESCSPSSSIAIEFNEFMNKTSVEEAFSYTNGNKIWTSVNGTIVWFADDVMQFRPDESWGVGVQYNCTITTNAKDDSDPGNVMVEDHTWSFVVAPGKGNFSVDVKYPPSTIAVGICQIKVTITNAVNAENRSGGLVVKFLKSTDGETFSTIDTKLVYGMFPNNSTTVYSNFTLSEGTWYLKVNISLLSPDDVIDSSTGYYETSAYKVEVVSPEQIGEEEEKEIGPGPYMLIAVMVVTVVLIGIYTIWAIGKKKKL